MIKELFEKVLLRNKIIRLHNKELIQINLFIKIMKLLMLVIEALHNLVEINKSKQ